MMLRSLSLAVVAIAALSTGSGAEAKAWPFGANIKNLVQFGDSYTDSTSWVATNGTAWGQYLASYAKYDLHNFAISGAICDNNTTPRTYFPDIKKDELGAYFNLTRSLPKKQQLKPAETLYTIWIGTNDVGAGELLTGQAAPGVSIVDVSKCAVDVVHTLYKSGARKFLFQNMIPLDQVPMYAKNGHPNRYWTAAHNATNWNIFMKELVAAGNALTSYMIRDLSTTLPGSTIGYFDSHAFFNDMYTHPTLYLNGTAPANVTGAVRECVLAEGQDTGGLAPCTLATGAARDSFLWADELHPSEQADRQLAQQIWKNLQGKSNKFITMYKN